MPCNPKTVKLGFSDNSKGAPMVWLASFSIWICGKPIEMSDAGKAKK